MSKKSSSPLNPDLLKLFLDRYQKEMDSIAPVQILVVGKTGVGKSTLVNAVFREPVAKTGAGLPVTKRLQRWEVDGLPLVLYDSRGIELDEQIRTEITDEMLELIESKAQNDDPDDRIHLVWYCVNDLSSRIEPYEIELMRTLGEHVPVILVLTQSIRNPSPLKMTAIDMDLPVEGVLAVLAKDFPLRGDEVVEAFGLEELVNLSLYVLPDEMEGAFINAQKVDLPRKIARAQRAVRGYVTSAFATGFTPIPFSDAAVLVPMQVGMIAHLSSIFGISMQKGVMRSLVTAVGGAGGATFLGRSIVANLFKFLPGVGTVGGGMITGSTAAMLTYALGQAYIRLMAWMSRREMQGEAIEPGDAKKRLKRYWREEWKRYKKLKKGRKKRGPGDDPPRLEE